MSSMLPDDIRMHIRMRVSLFAQNLGDAVFSRDVDRITGVMEDFDQWICDALEAAVRDGRRHAVQSTNN